MQVEEALEAVNGAAAPQATRFLRKDAAAAAQAAQAAAAAGGASTSSGPAAAKARAFHCVAGLPGSHA